MSPITRVKAFAWNRRASSMLSRRVRRSSAAWLRTPTKGRGSDESAHGRYSDEGPARSYAASSSDEEADDDLEGDLGRRSDRRESVRSPLSPVRSYAVTTAFTPAKAPRTRRSSVDESTPAGLRTPTSQRTAGLAPMAMRSFDDDDDGGGGGHENGGNYGGNYGNYGNLGRSSGLASRASDRTSDRRTSLQSVDEEDSPAGGENGPPRGGDEVVLPINPARWHQTDGSSRAVTKDRRRRQGVVHRMSSLLHVSMR